ncbi:hypothetical protein PRIPAC_92148, partial [Pristionchus pacificus]
SFSLPPLARLSTGYSSPLRTTTQMRIFFKMRKFIATAYSPRYLLFTNVFTTTTLLGTADVIQQSINRKKHPETDWKQAGRMMSIGLVYGPMSHFWYKFLESRMLPGTLWMRIGQKVFWDTLATPFFSAVVIIGVGILEGNGVAKSVREYWQKLYCILLLDCSLWPPFQVVNFRYIPAKFRVIACNCVTLLYNIGLSYIKRMEMLHGVE